MTNRHTVKAKASGTGTTDHSTPFLGENDSGLDRTSRPPHKRDAPSDNLASPAPAVLHVVVDVADVPALEQEGGPEAVAEVVREAIERDGLHSVIRRLREHAEG